MLFSISSQIEQVVFHISVKLKIILKIQTTAYEKRLKLSSFIHSLHKIKNIVVKTHIIINKQLKNNLNLSISLKNFFTLNHSFLNYFLFCIK